MLLICPIQITLRTTMSCYEIQDEILIMTAFLSTDFVSFAIYTMIYGYIMSLWGSG